MKSSKVKGLSVKVQKQSFFAKATKDKSDKSQSTKTC